MKLSTQIFKGLPAHEKRITVATMFTIGRIITTPFIIVAMSGQYWGVAFILFSAAAISDMIDGVLARYFGERTFLGACLDPIADKLLLVSCFFMLAFIKSPLFVLPRWFWFLLFSKELLQISGAVLIYGIKGHLEVKPLLFGKIVAVMQMIFIGWLFVCRFFEWMPVKTYYVTLIVISGMASLSLIQYVRVGYQIFYRT